MLESYDDIRKRIPEEPKWHDCHGVPRYDDFEPGLSPNVYADEVVLFEIACNVCDRRYLVEKNWSRVDGRGRTTSSLTERIHDKKLFYGDPPCWECGSGATMCSNEKQTVQFWSRLNKQREWRRVSELENVILDPEWAGKEWPD